MMITNSAITGRTSITVIMITSRSED